MINDRPIESPIVPDFKVRLQSDTEPQSFCSEPRVISHEVCAMRRQLEAFRQVLERLVDLLQEIDRKITPHGINLNGLPQAAKIEKQESNYEKAKV